MVVNDPLPINFIAEDKPVSSLSRNMSVKMPVSLAQERLPLHLRRSSRKRPFADMDSEDEFHLARAVKLDLKPSALTPLTPITPTTVPPSNKKAKVSVTNQCDKNNDTHRPWEQAPSDRP